MSIRKRLLSENSPFGKFLKGTVAITLLTATALGEIGTATGLLQEEWIPRWLKFTLIGSSVLTRVVGSLSVTPIVRKDIQRRDAQEAYDRRELKNKEDGSN